MNRDQRQAIREAVLDLLAGVPRGLLTRQLADRLQAEGVLPEGDRPHALALVRRACVSLARACRVVGRRVWDKRARGLFWSLPQPPRRETLPALLGIAVASWIRW